MFWMELSYYHVQGVCFMTSGIQSSLLSKHRLHFWPASQVILLQIYGFKQTCFRRWHRPNFILNWICLKNIVLNYGLSTVQNGFTLFLMREASFKSLYLYILQKSENTTIWVRQNNVKLFSAFKTLTIWVKISTNEK